MAGPEKPILLCLDSSPNTSSCLSNSETLFPEFTPPEISSLKKLSENLDSLFQSPDFDLYSDAKLVSGDEREIRVHRCILAARSLFFRQLFAGKEKNRYEVKELAKDYVVSFDALVSVLEYMYSGKVKPLPSKICECVDEDCGHEACRPVIDFSVQALYASHLFQITDLIDVWMVRLLEILDKVAKDDILIILLVANMCDKGSGRLLTACIDIVVKSDIDITTLEKSLPHDLVKLIVETRENLGLATEHNAPPDKHVRRIHRALDSDDVELVRLLLKEGHTTLDDAYALHYAVAYCDSKTTTELLDIGLADVNLRNPRGYTVLHVAALRREPKIIVSLLTKGARPADLTVDGRKALQISKRLTKSSLYETTEEGNASPKERLCIEILEQAERRDPLLGEASVSLAMAGEDLRSKLLYLETRVALAKLLFPTEAKVAMDIAHVEGTPEFSLAKVDLNESPFIMKEEHLARLRALSKTVELGKRFFPRCSDVLNKIVDDDGLGELACLSTGTSDEQVRKRRRYMELQEQLSKAFTEDKEERDRTAMSSCSSSTSVAERGRARMPRR
ncbi:Regulatory protein [Nymphaea thermarum]|nr:Regulatory protein [Nymphaea thermarum]